MDIKAQKSHLTTITVNNIIKTAISRVLCYYGCCILHRLNIPPKYNCHRKCRMQFQTVRRSDSKTWWWYPFSLEYRVKRPYFSLRVWSACLFPRCRNLPQAKCWKDEAVNDSWFLIYLLTLTLCAGILFILIISNKHILEY